MMQALFAEEEGAVPEGGGAADAGPIEIEVDAPIDPNAQQVDVNANANVDIAADPGPLIGPLPYNEVGPLENYVVVLGLFRFLPNDQVLLFRRTCSTWATAGAVTLAGRPNGNFKAQLTFEKEKDSKRVLGKLNKLLARTASPKLFLPAESGSLSITNKCFNSRTEIRNTPSFQVFLQKHGGHLRSICYYRDVVNQETDPEMWNHVRKILESCKYLEDLVFLPFKTRARIQPGVVVDAFQAGLAWTPVANPVTSLGTLGPLHLTSLTVQMVHPHHLAVLVRAAPELKTFAVLSPENNGRSMDAQLTDWTIFAQEMMGMRANNVGGLPEVRPGLDGITTLCLQNWDLIPVVPMQKLRTIKLVIRDAWTTIPPSNTPLLSQTQDMNQITAVHFAYRLPAPVPAEVALFHRFLNRFPSASSLFLDFAPERFWVVPQIDATRILFNEGQDGCLLNRNVQQLHIHQLKLYKTQDEPDLLSPLEFLPARFPEVTHFTFEVGTLPIRIMGWQPEHELEAIFGVVDKFSKIKSFTISKIRIWSSELEKAMSRIGFIDRLDSLIVNQETPPKTLFNELERQEKRLILACILSGRWLPHFQLSGFESQLDSEYTRAVLIREERSLRNVSFKKYAFSKIFTDGMTICKKLPKIKF